MRVLIVKTSSLGDVLHTLPALTEAAQARPELVFDWVVEPAFAEIPAWHEAVDRVVEAPLRALRRSTPGTALAGLRHLDGALRARRYDHIVDAQGLLKSALLALRARGPRSGLDRASVREGSAALCYGERIAVPRSLHAVERVRRLFAAVLGHEMAGAAHDHGIGTKVRALRGAAEPRDEVLLLHGTSWRSKLWPEAHWRELAARLAAHGLVPRVPWGDAAEAARAERIAAAGGGEVLPRTNLEGLLGGIVHGRGVVGVDGGPLHLAAAAGVPGVALYGPTDARLTAPWSPLLRVLRSDLPCAPCRARVCRSPLPPLGRPAAQEPPCLGRLLPARVEGVLLEALDGQGAP